MGRTHSCEFSLNVGFGEESINEAVTKLFAIVRADDFRAKDRMVTCDLA